MWRVCHLRADSVVWLSHTSSIWPWSGAPKVFLYDTFLDGLRQARHYRGGILEEPRSLLVGDEVVHCEGSWLQMGANLD